jgi:OmpA-OmpF porin, OOP family
MRKTALSVAALALMLSSGAFAQGYVGIGGGPTKANIDCSGTLTCDTTSTGFKLFGGYKFSPNWGAEVNYFDFGKAKFTVSDGGSGIIPLDLKGTGFGAGVAFFGQFAPDWSGVARLGVASTKAKGSAVVSGVSGSVSESSTNPYFGLGVSYALSKAVTLDGAIDFSKLKFAGESANVRMLSIGVTFGF